MFTTFLLSVVCISSVNAARLEGNAKYDEGIGSDTEDKELLRAQPLQGQINGDNYPPAQLPATGALDSMQSGASLANNRIRRPLSGSLISVDIKKASDQHGEEVWGVVGAHFDPPTGLIRFVYPESYAYAARLRAGDRILYDNDYGRYSGNLEVERSRYRGAPGTLVHLTISRVGRAIELNIPRTDSRKLAHYDGYFFDVATWTKRW
jgi:hypothetical protein